MRNVGGGDEKIRKGRLIKYYKILVKLIEFAFELGMLYNENLNLTNMLFINDNLTFCYILNAQYVYRYFFLRKTYG